MTLFVNAPTVPTPKRMLSKTTLVAAALATALSGCNMTAFAQNGISPAYLTGVWQETPQCAGNEAMVFFANNTMSSAGSPPVNYAVTGPSQFTMHGPGGAIPIQAQQLNYNQMMVTFQGRPLMLYRCGAANTGWGNNAQIVNTSIVGGWGHNGNCAVPEVFSAAGVFTSNQTVLGTWAMSGNLLRVTHHNGTGLDFTVRFNNPQNMTMTQNNNGQVSNYMRCF